MIKAKMSNPIHFLAFGFGSGLSPWAPGTMGTIAAIPLYYLLSTLDLWVYLSATVIISLVGIYLCGKTSADMQVHDHGGIVWDEIAGFLITMIAIPFSWQNILIGFVLFRFFDIIKPWPIKAIDKHVQGGFGIMLDDILAGIFAWICLYYIVEWEWNLILG